MISLFNPTIDIAIFGILLALISLLVQRKLVDRKLMKSIQKSMKEKQKKIKELSKEGHEKNKTEIDRLQKEMLEDSSRMMKGSMKHMLVIAVIFFPVFWFISTNYDGSITPIGEFMGFKGHYTWYIAVSITASIAMNIIFKIIDKVKEGKNG
ncbi:MAG: EMC3/TMCO1 family protein [archaeon]